MEWDAGPSGNESTLGYDRAAVEAFLVAAAEERAKLQEQIDQSNVRLARARTALGTHRVMVAMLLETQRELSALRRAAERDAAGIIAAAEQDAREREAPGRVSSAPSVSDSIDLRDRTTAADPSGFGVAVVAGPASGDAAGDGTGFPGDDVTIASAGECDDEFFEYLRGALHDDEPLGPRSDRGGRQ